jgi:hypothetical protein
MRSFTLILRCASFRSLCPFRHWRTDYRCSALPSLWRVRTILRSTSQDPSRLITSPFGHGFNCRIAALLQVTRRIFGYAFGNPIRAKYGLQHVSQLHRSALCPIKGRSIEHKGFLVQVNKVGYPSLYERLKWLLMTQHERGVRNDLLAFI